MAPVEADPATRTAEDERKRRAPAALFRIAERHGATSAARARTGGAALAPRDAVRLVELLGAGTAARQPGEDAVDADDLLEALTLLPLVRAELDETELTLLLLARGRGLTWSQTAEALGLRSPQAVQQRFERLRSRVDDAV